MSEYVLQKGRTEDAGELFAYVLERLEWYVGVKDWRQKLLDKYVELKARTSLLSGSEFEPGATLRSDLWGEFAAMWHRNEVYDGFPHPDRGAP